MSSKLVICFCVILLQFFEASGDYISPKRASFSKYVKMPMSCLTKPDARSNGTICFEKGNHYPGDQIEELLKEMPIIERIKEVTSVDRDGQLPLNDACPASDCPAACTEDHLVYYIKDTEHNTRVVVQSDKLQQVVNMRWCQSEGQIMDGTQNIVLPNEYKLTCATKYLIDFSFIVLSENGMHLEKAKPLYGIPICCTCRSQK